MFGDDTILYLFVDNPVRNAELLRGLEKISKWATEWLVKFSPGKTKNMVLTRKKKHKQLSPLKMSGTSLQVFCHTHLGVRIAQDLSWDEHIENLAGQ